MTKFSILLCTRNSARTIESTLKSINEQNDIHNILEVIVVDYRSNDDTQLIVKNILSNSKFNCTFLNCDKVGKAPALEIGFDVAEGDYVIVVDDDNVLDPEFIQEAKKILIGNNPGCVGSKGFITDELTIEDWFEKFQSVYAIGLPINNKVVDWVFGACSIIKRTAWVKLREKGFSFILNPARSSSEVAISIGGEDVELALAIKLLGFEIITSEQLKFYHNFPQSRLSLDYLYQSSFGVSRSVPIHEIYRSIIYSSSFFRGRLYWYFRVAKKIIGCIKNILKFYLVGDVVSRKVFQETLKGIVDGLIYYHASYKNIYSNLRMIHESHD